MELLLLGLAALFAGFVDSIVGGGGLVLVPALFTAFPDAAPATLFGTNKAGAIWGTTASMRSYIRRVQPPWSTVLPATLAAFVGALGGAWLITLVKSSDFRQALPFILLAVLLYTLKRKDLGHHHAPHRSGRAERALAVGGGLLIGFYDGFFGPGTGNFLIFLFVRGFGFDFLHASAGAKVVNVACNLAALLVFASKGHVMWPYALLIALCNISGSLLGTHLALRRGTHFVRGMFLLVVAALIVKTAHDAFF
ncbi:MAG: sulfite exporter TauE/SafE family protein [Thiomonas sp.]